jgi:hypothetical protein
VQRAVTKGYFLYLLKIAHLVDHGVNAICPFVAYNEYRYFFLKNSPCALKKNYREGAGAVSCYNALKKEVYGNRDGFLLNVLNFSIPKIKIARVSGLNACSSPGRRLARPGHGITGGEHL